jgi:hypothetical protein
MKLPDLITQSSDSGVADVSRVLVKHIVHYGVNLLAQAKKP